MKIILSVLFLMNAIAHAQSGKNCKVLSEFLNSREVSESFSLPESKDSIIMIALGSTEWGICRGFDWHGRVITQSNDTNDLANARKAEPHIFFRNRSNVFILTEFKTLKKGYRISIMHPATNLITEGIIIMSNKGSKKISIRKFVM